MELSTNMKAQGLHTLQRKSSRGSSPLNRTIKISRKALANCRLAEFAKSQTFPFYPIFCRFVLFISTFLTHSNFQSTLIGGIR